MNNLPLFNVPGASQGSSQRSTRSSRRSNSSNLPDPYQRARRKRAVSRQKRRFEAVVARLPKPTNLRLQLQGITIPAVLQPTPWAISKAISLLLLLGTLTCLFLLHSEEEWFVYREDVRFHNLIRMRGDDLYQVIEMDGMNIFWVEAGAIREKLLDLPWIEDARVEVTLPGSIAVHVTEVTPAAVWVTNEGNYWLSSSGAALPIATIDESALPELALPQIIDSLQEARAVGDGPLAIDPQVLNSALTLVAAMPELGGTVRYNESIGLNFPLPEPAVWVYWGDGFDLDSKMENLAVAREMVRKAEEPPQIVDVRWVERPYVH